jgi:hypothetical protein
MRRFRKDSRLSRQINRPRLLEKWAAWEAWAAVWVEWAVWEEWVEWAAAELAAWEACSEVQKLKPN